MAMKNILYYSLIAFLAMALFSCSSDDSKDDGSGNTSDVAVTGRVIETGMTYALAEGYVNLDKLTAGYESVEIGISVKSSKNNREQFYKTSGVEGRKISVELTALTPSTSYTFRTYVKVGGIYQYGEQKTFTTKEGKGVVTTGMAKDIALFSATLTADVNWDGLSEKENVYVVIGYSQNREDLTDNESLINHDYSLNDYYFMQGTEEKGFFISNSRKVTHEQKVTKFAANAHYFYCAYTLLGSQLIASAVKEFSTPDATKFVVTGNASDVKQCTATVDTRFDLAGFYDSSSETLSYSVLFATNSEELADENKRNEVATDGGKVTLYPLLPNTTYYYQAKAQIGNNQVALGEIKTVTTSNLQQAGVVDLGLSCKWAACDLGASSPATEGVRYAFAETETKEEFYGGNYVFGSFSAFAGLPENISGTEYDAATHQLGTPWRMPTTDEVKELQQKCQVTDANYNGTYGSFYLSENGNAIFMSSQWHWSSFFYRSHFGHVQPDGAYCFAGKALVSWVYYDGLYIRPVQ